MVAIFRFGSPLCFVHIWSPGPLIFKSSSANSNPLVILSNNFSLSLESWFLDSESKGLKNFYISANLDNLLIFNNVIFGKNKLIYDYQDNILNEFSINSKYFGDEDFSLFCSNDGNNSNKNKYELFASDAGKFFKTLNYTTEIMDGVFSS